MTEQCKQTRMDGYHQVGCSRKAKRDGYCTQHHPDTVKARREESSRKWKEKWARELDVSSRKHRERNLGRVVIEVLGEDITPEELRRRLQ